MITITIITIIPKTITITSIIAITMITIIPIPITMIPKTIHQFWRGLRRRVNMVGVNMVLA